MSAIPHSINLTNKTDRETADIETDCPLPCHFVEPGLRSYIWLKLAVDWVAAVLLLIVSFPVVALAALGVKLTSRGPAFYCQRRLGRGGRPFTLVKLRTMVHNAEALTGAVWSQANDPRVTRFGRFLRDTHIDEFPQLVNVLLGQLSIVGPRPERPEIAERLELQIPQYPNRLNAPPGITGLAQLLLPADSDLSSVRKKLVYDLYYVRYMSPWLDFRILFFTACHLLRMIWRYVRRPLNLPPLPLIQQRLQEDVDLQASCAFPEHAEQRP